MVTAALLAHLERVVLQVQRIGDLVSVVVVVSGYDIGRLLCAIGKVLVIIGRRPTCELLGRCYDRLKLSLVLGFHAGIFACVLVSRCS